MGEGFSVKSPSAQQLIKAPTGSWAVTVRYPVVDNTDQAGYASKCRSNNLNVGERSAGRLLSPATHSAVTALPSAVSRTPKK